MTTLNYPEYPRLASSHRNVATYLEGFARGLTTFEPGQQSTVHGEPGVFYYRHEGDVILNTCNTLLGQGIALAAIIRAHDPELGSEIAEMDARQEDVQRLIRQSKTVYSLDVNLRASIMGVYERVVPNWQELMNATGEMQLRCSYLFGQQFGLGEFEQPQS